MAEMRPNGQLVFHLVCPPLKVCASKFVRFDAFKMVCVDHSDRKCYLNLYPKSFEMSEYWFMLVPIKLGFTNKTVVVPLIYFFEKLLG